MKILCYSQIDSIVYYTWIYIYIYVCVCVCVYNFNSIDVLFYIQNAEYNCPYISVDVGHLSYCVLIQPIRSW